MNPKRFLRSTCSVLCLCLLGLSACGTSSTPPTGNTLGASRCATAGKTHTIQAAMSTPAAQGNWPMFHSDLNRDGTATPRGGSMLTPAWSYCTGAAVLSSPVVSAGVVYIASTNSTLAALDARSGQLLWQFRTDGALYSSPAVRDGMGYIGALDGFVYAVDAASGL